MSQKWKHRIGVSTFAAVFLLFCIWRMGWFGLWHEGMAYIANNTDDFEETGYPVEGTYSVSIDLSDLESNVGKVLYRDEDHQIYVAWVDNTGSVNSGGYRIGFRSSGQYSLSGATLVSGGHHVTKGDHEFATEMTARMTATYRGRTYESPVYGVAGLNYRDGDEFSFYLFPSSAYEANEVTLQETGVVDVKVTNLFKNVWSKKDRRAEIRLGTF